MNSLDLGAITVTSTLLALTFTHVIKESILNLKRDRDSFEMAEIGECNVENDTLSRRIFRLLLLHVGVNNIGLLILLTLVSGLITLFSRTYVNALCFLVGSVTSLLGGVLAVLVCRKTTVKLLHTSHKGLQEVYKRCIGTSSALVVLTLGLSLSSLFAVSSLFTLKGSLSDPAELTTSLSLFAFGSVFVSLYSRLSGGSFTSSSDILMDCNMNGHEEHKTLFENMNNYLQNIYQVILEVMAVAATVSCTFFMVVGQYTNGGEPLASVFGYMNFPMLHLALSMSVYSGFVTIFSFTRRNDTLNRVKLTYLFTAVASMVVTFCFLPVVHWLFLPEKLDQVRYSKLLNSGLVVLGLVSGILICLSNHFYLSRFSGPGRSITLSVLSSITGGVVNSLSYSKLFSMIPMLIFSVNLFICFVSSGLYGILFVAIGFMCCLPVVVAGPVFYSLVFTSSKLAEQALGTFDILVTFKSLKSWWYNVNTVTTPFVFSLTALLGVVLLNHLSDRLGVKDSTYLNPFVLVSLVLGCLFPVFLSGLILRMSSEIANMRLKKTKIFDALKELYVLKDSDSDKETDSQETSKPARRFFDFFKRGKRNESNDYNLDSDGDGGDDSGDMDRAKPRTFHSSHDTKHSSQDHRHDNRGLVNYDSDSTQIEDDNANDNTDNSNYQTKNDQDSNKANNENTVVQTEGEGAEEPKEQEEHYKRFRGGFKACVLKEAGVNEQALLNAPISCASSRSITPYSHSIENAVRKEVSTDVSSYDAEEPIGDPDMAKEVAVTPEHYRHSSRDYRILKNADTHYRMFHSKYHVKHFNLRKRSTVGSGELEELQTLLPLRQNDEGDALETKLGPEAEAQLETKGEDNLDKVVRRSINIELEFGDLAPETVSCLESTIRDTERRPEVILARPNPVHSRPMEGGPNSPFNGHLNSETEGSRRTAPEGTNCQEKNRRRGGSLWRMHNEGWRTVGEPSDSQARDVIRKRSSRAAREKLTPYMQDSSSNSEDAEDEPCREGGHGPSATSQEGELDTQIAVRKGLLPPDVDISNQPRRPTPKRIEVPDFRDLEAALSEVDTPRSQPCHLGAAKNSPYQNTYAAMLLALIPLGSAFGVPFLVGVAFGRNAVFVTVLFSCLTSSIMVQVLHLLVSSLERTLYTIRDRGLWKTPGTQAINSVDTAKAHTCHRIGKIVSTSVGPVLNVLILALPLACIYAAELFNSCSNRAGFPRWLRS